MKLVAAGPLGTGTCRAEGRLWHFVLHVGVVLFLYDEHCRLNVWGPPPNSQVKTSPPT